MKKILPPDVSDKQFAKALAAFREAVGEKLMYRCDISFDKMLCLKVLSQCSF